MSGVPAADSLRQIVAYFGLRLPAPDMVEVSRAADLLDAIDALHQPIEGYLIRVMCATCKVPHPCPTARLLHPEATDE